MKEIWKWFSLLVTNLLGANFLDPNLIRLRSFASFFLTSDDQVYMIYITRCEQAMLLVVISRLITERWLKMAAKLVDQISLQCDHPSSRCYCSLAGLWPFSKAKILFPLLIILLVVIVIAIVLVVIVFAVVVLMVFVFAVLFIVFVVGVGVFLHLKIRSKKRRSQSSYPRKSHFHHSSIARRQTKFHR